jgi:2-desacetyl-2-hydroxyethyl bacteriochlorophyllide A dehydrogenase
MIDVTSAVPTTMRRVIVSADRGPTIEHSSVPTPQAGEALVRMTAVGVCGSDTHAMHGQHPFISLPYAPGHEVAGVVAELSLNATGVSVGQRVVVEPTLPCWTCKQCKAGRINLCESLKFFGCVYDQGGMADFFSIPANRLHPVPDALDDRQAVLIEPLSTPVHAARLAGPIDGKAVAILGAGAIGLLLLRVVLDQGARRIVVTDVLNNKRQRALQLGAHAVVDAARPDVAATVRQELGESADIVFDCVANQRTVDQAVTMALKGGTVAIVGVPAGPVSVPLPEIQDLQVKIQGSATYEPQDFDQAIRLLLAGQVRSEDFVTGVYSLDQTANAFHASTSGEHVKVILTPDAGQNDPS